MPKWEKDPYDLMAQIAQSRVGQSISNRIKTEGCPSLEVLDLYLERKLPQEQAESVKTHLVFCNGCAKEILLRERVFEEMLEEELIEWVKESYTEASRRAEVEKPSRTKSALRFLRSMDYVEAAIAFIYIALLVGMVLVFLLIMTRLSGQDPPPGSGSEVIKDRVGRSSLTIRSKGKVFYVKAFTWKLPQRSYGRSFHQPFFQQLLTFDAMARPWHGFQPLLLNLLATVQALAVTIFL